MAAALAEPVAPRSLPAHLPLPLPSSLPVVPRLRATRGDLSASTTKKKKIGRVLSCCRRRTMIIHCQGEDTPLRPESDSGPSSTSLGRGLKRRLVPATGSVNLQKDGDVVRKAVMMIVHTLSSCSNCRQRISAIRTRSSRPKKAPLKIPSGLLLSLEWHTASRDRSGRFRQLFSILTSGFCALRQSSTGRSK